MNTDMIDADFMRSVVKEIEAITRVAISGGCAIKEPGTEYLPDLRAEDFEEKTDNFKAHAWVRNAIFLAYVLGGARQRTDNFAPDDSQCAFFAGFIGAGVDVYSIVEGVTKE